jgi:hypothetical protein
MRGRIALPKLARNVLSTAIDFARSAFEMRCVFASLLHNGGKLAGDFELTGSAQPEQRHQLCARSGVVLR